MRRHEIHRSVPHGRVWASWRHSQTGQIVRTFCIIATRANELMADIHDPIPAILPPEACERWLANIEPDPRGLLVPFAADMMMMWQVSTRVNQPDKDDAAILGLRSP